MKEKFNFLFNRQNAGSYLSIISAIIGIIGSLINTIFFNHNAAILIWMVSNPMLVIWAYGGDRGWWNGSGLSYRALFIMYLVYTMSGVYAVVVGGML